MIKNIAIILLILCSLVVSAQIPTEDVEVDIKLFPREKPLLYINSDVILAGESLQYKISILNNSNSQSKLSKIAYVSLRDQNDSVVFNHKLKLKNGSANSDFFLPANLKSGVYNLIGYTNFSRNNTVEAFNEKNIYVINTFMENIGVSKTTDTVKVNAISLDALDFSSQNINEQAVRIKTDKHSYGYREKVTLTFGPSVKNDGDYVLSVRQVNPLEISDQVSKPSQINTSNVFYLPELRGEVVSGVVLSNVDKSLIPNKEVSLTVPGKDFIFKLAKTDRNGRFFFSISEDYSAEKSLVQIVGVKEDAERFTLVLDQKDLILERTKHSVLKLDPKLKEWLQERSVQLQIENAYFGKKRDSVFPRKSHPSFYDEMGVLYLLDDFTRFPTVRETFIEIVTLAAIRGSGENSRFLVYNDYDPKGIKNFNDIAPLVLLDGMMIQDADELLNYNARDIKSIRVINKPYRYGPKLFSGIISVATIKGDFMLSKKSQIEEVDLPPTVQEKLYFKPNYLENLASSRIPDFRVQLLWNPQIVLSTSESSTSFYTSDVPGIYEIRLEGFDKAGTPILLKNYFKVLQE